MTEDASVSLGAPEESFFQKTENTIATDSRVVVVDCFAEWCGPCKRISPEIDKLEQKYEGKIVVIKVDVDTEDEFSILHEVTSMPTIIIFKDGQEIDRQVGADMVAINEKITKALLS